MSTCEVTDTTIYNKGVPNPFGINDHRMGSVDRRHLCGTCCRDVRLCQGHTGHIALSYPMYHVSFFEMTLKCLRCVCFSCSVVLASDDEKMSLGEFGKNRFNSLYSTLKTRKKCFKCQFPQPTYIRCPLGIKTSWTADTSWESEDEKEYCTQPFMQHDALSILKRISDADCLFLGLDPKVCHPKHLIITNMMVAPPIARPAFMTSEGSKSRGQDDITMKYQDINKKSIDIAQVLPDDYFLTRQLSADLMERIHKLQFDVFTIMNNNIRGQKQSVQRSGQPHKSLQDRLKGKDGRIRGNLMGKRVDFSARTVITPDPVMDVDQVGVPYKIAMSLTLPEKVTSRNIEKLANRVRNGPDHVYGAINVITSDGVMISLDSCLNRDKIRLQYGWIVERTLQDNDIVIFNRQPSLHKMGMMGHRVKLMKGSTFRLNLCTCNSYNADFDGDEMNLHVPQSQTSIADTAMLMMVSRQIISPQANRPIMGIVQDSLLAAFLMSQPSTMVTKTMACHILAHLKYNKPNLPEPCIQSPIQLWSGKQIVSVIFPESMYYGMQCKTSQIETHTRCIVKRGELLTGNLDKSMLGTSSGGIIDFLFREYGSLVLIRYMSEIQRLVNSWLMHRGFAVGISDCVLPLKGEERVQERIAKTIQHSEDLLHETSASKTSSEHSRVEDTIVQMMSKTLMQTGGIIDEELHPLNAIRLMVTAGSKGNPINLSQICGCVGQQSVEGQRIFPEKGTRTLPCFDFVDKSLTGQGFVQNSYALGLHPHEYFFHSMGGREGLVDTAVKTSVTGYIQRRQVKAMEDFKVAYDGTVRDADECIVDFSYGGDGMDAVRIERFALPLLKEDDDSIRKRMTEWEAEQAIRAKNKILECKTNICAMEFDSKLLCPINPHRIRIGTQHTTLSEAEEDSIIELVQCTVDSKMSAVFKVVLLSFFHSDVFLKAGWRFEKVDQLFKSMIRKWDAARVHPCEMVGSIAAQSIGEPATQLTLNSFHTAGNVHKNVTLGIPRLKELLDQAKNIKTPLTTIVFYSPWSTSQEFVTYFANTIPLTKLSDIVHSCDFLYDPDDLAGVDTDMIQMSAAFGYSRQSHDSNFVVRLLLNQKVMRLRHLTPPQVRTLLRKRLSGKAYVISSETNEAEWVIRIRFYHMKHMMERFQTGKKEKEGLMCHQVISVLLDTFVVCGHVDAQSAYVREVADLLTNKKYYVVDMQGSNFVDLGHLDCVDWYSTTTNDVTQVYENLGIEAASNVLYHEFTSTISFDGTYVDPRHIMMVVNAMTRGGFVMPLSRHGINRMDTGPLLRSSFEETPDILSDAACFGEIDKGKGVSQNIMTGRLSNIGSGAITMQMHTSLLHPRSIHLSTKIQQKRILKSKIRSQKFESQTNFARVHFSTLELPYNDVHDAPECKKNNIFTPKDCDMPFQSNTSEDKIVNVVDNSPFRPSSPGEGFS